MTDLPKLKDATLEIDGGVAVFRFERDDVRNALTGTNLAKDIVATCEWVNANRDVACLILTGAGKSFSAGGNVYDMLEKKGTFGGTPMEIQQNYRSGIQTISRAIYGLETPSLAAVNGAAIGAGLDLAAMCDIRIASQYAKFGETFVNLGVVPGDGGAWFLPKVVGMQRAAELTFSGRIIDAEEAERIGLVLKVCEPEQLMPTCVDMAKGFASKPRDALRLAKRLLLMGERTELADFLDHCAAIQSLCHTTPEHEAAVQALVAQMKR